MSAFIDIAVLKYLIAASFLLVASYVDMKSMRIPNLLNLMLFAIAIAVNYQNLLCTYETCFLKGLLWGAIFGIGMYFVGVFGAGDAKLFIALGGVIGGPEVIATFIISLFLIVAWSFPVRLIKWGPKKMWEQEKQGLMFLILKIKMQRPKIEKMDVARAPLAPFILYGYLLLHLIILFSPNIF